MRFEDDRGAVYLVSNDVTYTHARMEPDVEYRSDENTHHSIETLTGKYELELTYVVGRATSYVHLMFNSKDRAEHAFNEYVKLLAD